MRKTLKSVLRVLIAGYKDQESYLGDDRNAFMRRESWETREWKRTPGL